MCSFCLFTFFALVRRYLLWDYCEVVGVCLLFHIVFLWSMYMWIVRHPFGNRCTLCNQQYFHSSMRIWIIVENAWNKNPIVFGSRIVRAVCICVCSRVHIYMSMYCTLYSGNTRENSEIVDVSIWGIMSLCSYFASGVYIGTCTLCSGMSSNLQHLLLLIPVSHSYVTDMLV